MWKIFGPAGSVLSWFFPSSLFSIALFALVIRKAGTWPIDYLFLYCLKRVSAPTLSFLWAGKHWPKVDRKTMDVPQSAKSRALR